MAQSNASNAPLKIAILGTAHPYRGGLASYNERLARQFSQEGHQVTVYTFSLQYPSFLFPGKTQFTDEPAPEDVRIVRCVNSVNPLNWLKVGRQIKKAGYDLVITKYWLPFMGACLGSILRIVRKNRHTKIITIVDNMIPHEPRVGDRQLTQYFVKPIDAFVAMSQSVMDDIHTFVSDKPKALSPHPLFDNFGEVLKREEALEQLELSPEYRYILFFGLIRDYKGLDVLIEAFADPRFREQKLKLIIAGEYYSGRERYLELLAKHQLEDHTIETNSFISDSEVKRYFGAADVVVQPYKSATQSGVTQIAYHFNKPMIVSNVGGLPELCPDDVVGYVVEPKADQIADAMHRFFAEGKREAFEANVKEEKKKYGWDIMTQKVLDLYNAL